MPFFRAGSLLVIAALLMGACQTAPTSVPAVLRTADAETINVVMSVLAGAMNRANIEIGPGDLTRTSTISVLPPELSSNEDRSTVKPTLFDIVLRGSSCYAVRRDTGQDYALNGVACRALED